MELHLISTGKQPKQTLVDVLSNVHSYADYIHLRERHFSVRDYLDTIDKLIAADVPLEKIIINDRVDVAYVVKACGVQLGAGSLPPEKVVQTFPGLRVGCSVHGINEATEKGKAGADYLVYGHVFPTASKPGLPPRGLAELRRVVGSISIPVIAIGGIKPRHVEQIKETGAEGIAVLSGILLADDARGAAAAYNDAIKGVT